MSLSILQSGGGPAEDNSATSVRAFGSNVTAGSRVSVIVVAGDVISRDPGDNFVAGDCVKSAGTATIGTITLDKTVKNLDTGAPLLIYVAVFSAVVTGSGSLTFTISAPISGHTIYWNTSYLEIAATGGTVNVDNTNSGSGTGTAPSAGAITPSAYQSVIAAGLGISATAANETLTVGGSFTLIDEEKNASLHMCGSAVQRNIASGSATASWTTNNWPWAAAAVAYIEPAAGGGATAKLLAALGVG